MDPKEVMDQIATAPNNLAKQLNIDPNRLGKQSKIDPNKLAKQLNINPKKTEPVLKSTRDWVLMIGAALYVLSPLDLIPEAIFGVFGMVDDFLVILLAAIWYYNKYKESTSSSSRFKFKQT